MTTSSIPYMKPPRRFYFSWIPGVIFKPKQTFASITSQASSWFTPMLVLTLAVLIHVLASGWVNQQIAATGVIPTPPDFQYWNQEMQNQYMQSQQVRQGSVFLYVIPAIGALSAAWIGWLIVGGMLHLATTLLGGRGETSASINLVAWANLPFAIREVVRGIYLLATRQPIAAEGLAGFVDSASGSAAVFLVSLLALVDIYLIWHVVLMAIGVHSHTRLPAGKATIGAASVVLIVVLIQALFGYLFSQLSALSVVRPFFF